MKLMRKMLTALLVLALVLCLAPAVFAAEPDGTEENPMPVTIDNGCYAMANVFDEAGTYWFTFTPEVGGLLNLEEIMDYSDFDVSDITITAYNVTANKYIEISNQKAAAPFTVWEGDEVLIGITAPAEADVSVLAYIHEYDEYLMIPGYYAVMNDYSFYVCVDPGTTVTFGVPMMTGVANWSGMGLKVEGVFDPMSRFDPDPIPQTIVTVERTEYKDLKNDSNIQLTMPDAMFGSPEFSITYGSAMGYATYKITFVNETLTECDHANKTPVQASAPDCHVDGVLAHEVCDDCGCFFIDGNMVDTVVAPAPNSLEYVSATVTCTEPGNIAHYHCEGCGKNYDYDWETDTYTELATIASDALGHDMEGHEAMKPTCHSEGNHEWYFCNNCYGYFKDEDGNAAFEEYADIWLEPIPDAHAWVLAEEVDGEALENNVPAAHTATELIYLCECPTCWMENEAHDLTTVLLTPPSCGELTHHELDPATEDAEGTKEHWSCAVCNKLFSDAAGKTEVTAASLVIPKLDNPKTGDTASVVAAALVAILAVTGTAVIAKKKF